MTDHPLWLQRHQTFNFKHPIHQVAAASPFLSHLPTSLLSWQWQNLRGHKLNVYVAGQSRGHRDKHMFYGSMEPCSIVTGNLLTSPNSLSPFSHVHINTNGQKGWWDLYACTNTILLSCSCLSTGAQEQTHTQTVFFNYSWGRKYSEWKEERRQWWRERGRITDHKYASFSSFRPNKHLIK